MNIEERINLLIKLGEYLDLNDDALQSVKQKAEQKNAWFKQAFIELALLNIRQKFLQRSLLKDWVEQYKLQNNKALKAVGIVMAGNIPLVGFHDFLCVFASGNKALIKLSSKDDVLLKHFVQKMIEWNKAVQEFVTFDDNLKNCDAYIATGSNNSSRYFEYYFGKYPSIIRRNKTSVAILYGNESTEQLNLLADDIQQYFGMGCRNVSKLFVPEGYNFIPLLDALKKYNYFADFHKYKNNYDYQLALLIMNHKYYMTNESIILTENESVFAPVSQVNYAFYNEPKSLVKSLQNNADIQCIIGNNFIPLGKSQSPSLTDYADGVDTMQFLKQLPQSLKGVI